MTLAAVDRVVHHPTMLQMTVESDRRRAAQRSRSLTPTTHGLFTGGMAPTVHVRSPCKLRRTNVTKRTMRKPEKTAKTVAVYAKI